MLNFDIFDKDMMSKDDLIGQGTLAMSQACLVFNINYVQAPNHSQQVQLSYKGKNTGTLFVTFEWCAEAGSLNN